MSRVTSSLFVDSLIRNVQLAGGYATLEKRGAYEAGAIYIKHYNEQGLVQLFEPAMQSELGERNERAFVPCFKNYISEDLLRERMLKLQKFDSDLWLVAIEATKLDFLKTIVRIV